MSSLVLYMSMSLDGFIAGPGDTKDNPFGTGGQRLHEWLGPGGESVYDYRPGDEPSRAIFDEVMSTGAVITGRRTGDFTGYWGGDHHDGVPILVPTHQAPADTYPGDVRFVTDGIESCAEQAKAAAGDRDVMVHGAYTARECLRARVMDVMEIQLMPVLFGQGRRLFDGLGPDHIELQLVRALESPNALHLRYEVKYA
ncbi:MAG TPA: dihydrofolate reductase family protein [Streptosporangiaceae bacterium]|nr:dihydrofolate reductase family protein [Streptosporangiaceae bacterium]